VSLQATPNSGYVFSNWTGSSVANPNSAATTITMNGPSAITANFTVQSGTKYLFNVAIAPASSGAVTTTINGLPFSCSTTCSSQVTSGTVLTLTATPATGFTFGGWAGCPSASGNTCTLTVSSSVSIGASFNGNSFSFTLGSGSFNKKTNVFSQPVTVTNNGAATSGSVAFAADHLTAGVTMTNASGTTSATSPAGSPYIELGPIGANSSVTVTLQFTGASSVTFTGRVLGPGAR
jgi:hypothetical protein